MKKLTNWVKKNVAEDAPKEEKTKHQKDFHVKNRPVKNRHPRKLKKEESHPKAKGKSFGGGKRMRIVPLGGLEEVGKNIMAVEYGNDIVIIDAGMSFAGPDMLGVDYIVPDVSYLKERKKHVKGILITHGHLDHIGAIQHVLPELGNPPVYGTKLTCGLIRNRLAEFGLDKTAKIHEITEESKFKLGEFQCEFFHVNHSIPEPVGIYLKTPAGSIVHTGDFKFDFDPAIDKPANFQRIAEIGREGVDVLLIDSTNALRPGYCKSEREVADNLENIIAKTKGRLIIAAFSSLVGRVDQIIEYAAKHNRKVFLSGRSMINNVELSQQLGYINPPKGLVRKMGPQVNSLPPNQVIVLTTGAQGEAMSALTRMSIGEHRQMKLREGDTVVISASPIPGNELAVVNVINNLYEQGAKVITNGDMDVHVSGHAHQEELKLMYNLIKPKCYVPVHGEIYMRIGHGEMIKKIAEPGLNITILNNGDVLDISKKNGIRKSKEKIPANDILIDGLGFGDIGSKVIHDRKQMSEDGIVMVLFKAYDKSKNLINEPDIISRGFLYLKESKEISQETKMVAKKAFEQITAKDQNIGLKDLKLEIERRLAQFIRKRLGREPMIIPIIHYV